MLPKAQQRPRLLLVVAAAGVTQVPAAGPGGLCPSSRVQPARPSWPAALLAAAAPAAWRTLLTQQAQSALTTQVPTWPMATATGRRGGGGAGGAAGIPAGHNDGCQQGSTAAPAAVLRAFVALLFACVHSF